MRTRSFRWYIFSEALSGIIEPRSQSNRTCFRNVTNWLVVGCAPGRFNDGIFDSVLDYAKEAAGAQDPAEIFVALLKKELGYRRFRPKMLVPQNKNEKV
jgi:hypothetical protein